LVLVLHRAADDHVVDVFGVDAAALHQVSQGVAEQFGRVPLAQDSASFTDRSAHGLDDHRLASVHVAAPCLDRTIVQ
jgi:hypothetical protein